MLKINASPKSLVERLCDFKFYAISVLLLFSRTRGQLHPDEFGSIEGGPRVCGDQRKRDGQGDQSVASELRLVASDFDTRKTARAGEIEGLNNAKAVLAGANYSLRDVSESESFSKESGFVSSLLPLPRSFSFLSA